MKGRGMEEAFAAAQVLGHENGILCFFLSLFSSAAAGGVNGQ